jgi:NAD(P)-dependent dehydrogenase (short-subunit alcohol dehydrogenase family)
MLDLPHPDRQSAYVITGPTSGLGRCAAFALAQHGQVVLVGRNPDKLKELGLSIERRGGHAITVVCDFSDLASVRCASAELISMKLPIAGLLNNAGVQNPAVPRTADGWDMTFATNHMGPFALTDALLPHLGTGARVLFIGSATEDPDRGPAQRAGFRGGRYISASASARGEWMAGGSTRPGMDAYATSKQCNIASALSLAREYPKLKINAMEPGIMFNTGLHKTMNPALMVLARGLAPLLAPFVKVLSTPQRATRVITGILTRSPGDTGVYYDEGGHPMHGSALVHDPAFQNTVVAETRSLLSAISPQESHRNE